MAGGDQRPDYKNPHLELHPSTRPFVVGYDAKLSAMAIQPPVFRTSTFEFSSAEEGEESFGNAYELPNCSGKEPGLIYSRLNNPNMEIWEDRMVAVESGALCAAAFPSGMSAITTMVIALLVRGGRVLYTDPVYGGTYYFFRHLAERFDFRAVPVDTSDLNKVGNVLAASKEPFDMIFIETPANPTMAETDIAGIVELARCHGEGKTLVAVDNTYLGPVFQYPFELGADLVVYSATKFLGGHSDLIAGLVLARSDNLIKQIKGYRTILGPTIAADTAWLLTRSLGTCWIRMEAQAKGAGKVAQALVTHPKVDRVLFPGLLTPEDGNQYVIHQKQCSGPGSMITFFLKDPKKSAAFRLLNAVRVCHLAVSLGGIETLIEHPRTMTHSDMSPEDLDKCGITHSMIRLSVGVEDADDLINDLFQALNQV
ncbi:TPA: methionine gamma-lyase [Patescibacteria group bacterium]|nr:methionine gamma-lyase [Patescibacteria group bacterium]